MTNPAVIELKKIISKHNTNQLQLTFKSFLPQARLSEILNNKRRFTPEADIKLCKVFSLKPGHFLKLQQEFETKQAQNKYKTTLSKIIPL